MAKLSDVLAYVLGSYPHKHELSNARVNKIIYLADWHHALNYNQQITPISWYFDNYGPYVDDVKVTARKHPEIFKTEETSNFYGNPKLSFSLICDKPARLTEAERKSLDFAIEKTKKLYWDDFIKLIYSTHPIASSPRYSTLDLVQKAKEYRKLNKTT
ncbi:hypothetical protein J2848_004127 [Azospirillum lipoferum]|uniref:DUF4065 domain-containing protein n=1 Tax=Azospirillum lipoferum TaxID=193 RepID=A0A5A9GHQ5_AZOLI|nr:MULTISPECIES: Panacea domain-containing protein [Azospirillum]KAA0593961.1 DUF4065 domain-containing protein [Azospirillum lipoferum]MCP1612436.1 hypothetical protein [Azospirillum lipoferum]MDW5531780.1 Panacea domain-containing protein [Azospirillum sp. NL1]